MRVRLPYLDEMNEEKAAIAKRYSQEIKNPKLILPQIRENTSCVWHQYVIRCEKRDELAEYLKDRGIGTIIHYPIPPHLSEAYHYLGHKKGDLPITEHYADTVLSIPMYNGMEAEELDYIIEMINKF